MIEAFVLGGWGMFPTLGFGLLLFGTSLHYARKPEPRWVPLMLALGVLTLLTAALGFVTGLIATMAHLERVTTDRVPLVGALGFGESLYNIALGLTLSALAAVAAVVGAARAARQSGDLRVLG